MRRIVGCHRGRGGCPLRRGPFGREGFGGTRSRQGGIEEGQHGQHNRDGGLAGMMNRDGRQQQQQP
jgi:hypothetical protein